MAGRVSAAALNQPAHPDAGARAERPVRARTEVWGDGTPGRKWRSHHRLDLPSAPHPTTPSRRSQGMAEVVPILIQAGAYSSEADHEGFTAVEHALVRRDVDTAHALYCAGGIFSKRQLLLFGILLRESSLLRCAPLLRPTHRQAG